MCARARQIAPDSRHFPADTRATFVSDVRDTLMTCFGPDCSWGESDRQIPPDSGGAGRNTCRMYSRGEYRKANRAWIFSSGRAAAARETLA
jgi:hypothetical protein